MLARTCGPNNIKKIDCILKYLHKPKKIELLEASKNKHIMAEVTGGGYFRRNNKCLYMSHLLENSESRFT